VVTFEDMKQLDTTALRALFERGRPEQRMWAIWALAIRTGGIVAVADAARDPDPGVRRTIAVMLAAHGEHELLVAIARQDPVRAVRESAMQLVTRLAVQGVVDVAIVLEAARADPGVRGAILAEIGRGAPVFLIELALESLRNGKPPEQGDAFEALLRTETPAICRAALAWLGALPDAQARDACGRMLRAVGEFAFASELASAPRRLRVIAIGVLFQPRWTSVEQLVGDDAELLLSIVRAGDIEVPIEALARAALDGEAAPLVQRLSDDLAVIDAPSDALRPLLPLLDRHYGEWIAALGPDDDDHYSQERERAKRQLVKLRNQIQRLMRR
jgi:hypothetical protein